MPAFRLPASTRLTMALALMALGLLVGQMQSLSLEASVIIGLLAAGVFVTLDYFIP